MIDLPPADPRHAQQLWQRLQAALLPGMAPLLDRAITLAAAQGVALYLVGGPVRDAELRRPVTDLDLVVEDDAWPLAEAFQAATGGALRKHAAFRTAVVEIPTADGSVAIDFVTARREIYPAPAALPVISPSHIRDDLHRRDFTINTLALRLEPARVILLDPFAGLADLRAGRIRVLHDASFRDDPTRILRGARFAARLQLAVEPHTRGLIADALHAGMIAVTTPQRILHELWLTLDEPQPEAALALLHSWEAFAQLALVWSDAWPEQFAAARDARFGDVPLPELYLGLLLAPMNPDARAAFAARYNLPTHARKLLRELPTPTDPLLAELTVPQLPAIELERRLQSLSASALRTIQIIGTPTAAANVARYLAHIRPLPALLTGDDLRAAGIPPGPRYRLLLAALREAQLTGAIDTPAAARDWLRQRS